MATEFFSDSTSSRLVSTQVTKSRQGFADYESSDIAKEYARITHAAQSSVDRGIIPEGHIPGAATKATATFKRNLLKECHKAYGDSLLEAAWDGRKLHAWVFQHGESEESGAGSNRVFMCLYTFSTRTANWTTKIPCLITSHALQRLLQRKASFKLYEALKSELPISVFGSAAREAVRFLQTPEVPGGVKIDTNTGTACCVYDPSLRLLVMTTWYPNK